MAPYNISKNNMKEHFEEIYSENKWRYGSGVGSLPKHNQGYIKFLQQFLKIKNIQSVVDFGCGDWQFSRFIDWSGVQYQGYDIVESVVKNNQSVYSSENIQFHISPNDFNDLPAADLLITKDVIQHWSNASINIFLPHIKRYKYALITNCFNPAGDTINNDISDGSFRPLDIRKQPFNLHATEVFKYTNHRSFPFQYFRKTKWLKRVLFIEH